MVCRLELVAVEEVAEGNDQNGIRENARDGHAQMGLHVVDGGEDGLFHVRPTVDDGLAVEAQDVAVTDAAFEVGGDTLQDGDGRNGLKTGIGEALVAVFVALQEVVILPLEVETGIGIEGFGDHDLEEGQLFAAGVDAGEDLAGGVDVVFGNLDDGEVVASKRGAVVVDLAALVFVVGVEVGDVVGEKLVDGDDFATGRRFGEDDFFFGARECFQVDADVFVVDDAFFAGDAEAFADGVEGGDALLSVQDVLHGVAGRRLRKLEIAQLAIVAEAVAGLPQDEGADGKTLQDAVDELGGLRFVPDEVALEHGELGAARVDVGEEHIVFLGMILRPFRRRG